MHGAKVGKWLLTHQCSIFWEGIVKCKTMTMTWIHVKSAASDKSFLCGTMQLSQLKINMDYSEALCSSYIFIYFIIFFAWTLKLDKHVLWTGRGCSTDYQIIPWAQQWLHTVWSVCTYMYPGKKELCKTLDDPQSIIFNNGQHGKKRWTDLLAASAEVCECVCVCWHACVKIRAVWQPVGSACIRQFYSYCFSTGDPKQLSLPGWCIPKAPGTI